MAQGPIIDMHLHAFGFDEYGFPPPPNEATGVVPAFSDDSEFLAEIRRQLVSAGIVRAVASGPLDRVRQWRAALPQVMGGAYAGPRDTLPSIQQLRSAVEDGSVAVFGEWGLQYRGLHPNDGSLAPYWALAEELDVPVGVHTGLGDAGLTSSCCPDFRARLGSPLAYEDILVAHPDLRLYLMHAGYPFLDDTKALLTIYPQVYVDVAVINWAIPRDEFHAYLRALIVAGFGDRIMFGSDQMVWPESIPLAVEGVSSAAFLTPSQKEAIFYDNAARFLRLSPEEVAADHARARSPLPPN